MAKLFLFFSSMFAGCFQRSDTARLHLMDSGCCRLPQMAYNPMLSSHQNVKHKATTQAPMPYIAKQKGLYKSIPASPNLPYTKYKYYMKFFIFFFIKF